VHREERWLGRGWSEAESKACLEPWGKRPSGPCSVVVWIASPVHADVTPLSSQLDASSVADVDPGTGSSVPDEDSDGTPDGNLHGLSVSTFQSDSAVPDLLEEVTATSSVVYSGNDLLTVEMFGARSGTGVSAGSDCGSSAHFDLFFQNLAVGSITVNWTITFERQTAPAPTPFGITVRRGGIVDSRSPSVPLMDLSGVASGSETFDLNETSQAFYDLDLDFVMAGSTSHPADPESWNATFTVHTPPMTITPVPEPSRPALALVGLAILGLLRRFRQA
jgi:hypothetical protein